MRIGVLVTGDVAVRAAHSLSPHPGIDEVVVIGPARSRNFEVVADATGCDLLVGSGEEAPEQARRHGVPLIWDGDHPDAGVSVWGASPQGLALALAAREEDPRLVAVAHPGLTAGNERRVRFADPVGNVEVTDVRYGDRIVAVGRSAPSFAGCLAAGPHRDVTIVDDASFLAGVALAAGALVTDGGPVWGAALPYLQAAAAMGLVMAEAGGG